ncbi:MAG TPA: antibiotic biosynthesis monooxygenase [Cellvibrionaceae bacterium]
MGITRINTFQAKEGNLNNVRDFLQSIIPLIQRAEGCSSCRLLQSHDKIHEFIIIEEWDSIESHQASIKHIPADKLSALMPLLTQPPCGSYYTN